jgi:cell cycle arrest protein BUB2
MNVLAAPFLYVMSELDAFYCFSLFITKHCPLYVQPALEGVHSALKLLDLCLKVVDPELFGYLRGKNLTAELYAFPGKVIIKGEKTKGIIIVIRVEFDKMFSI